MKSKTIRIMLGIFIIIITVTIGYYQWQLSKFKGFETVRVITAKENILRGDTITANQLAEIVIDKRSVLRNAISNPAEIIGKIAAENLYEGEQITGNKLVSSNDWLKPNERIVDLSLSRDSDGYVAFEVKPHDRIDILTLDTNGPHVILENIEVLNAKDEALVQYKDRDKTKPFLTKYLVLKLTEEQYNKLYTAKATNKKIVTVIRQTLPAIDESAKRDKSIVNSPIMDIKN